MSNNYIEGCSKYIGQAVFVTLTTINVDKITSNDNLKCSLVSLLQTEMCILWVTAVGNLESTRLQTMYKEVERQKNLFITGA